jgi:putative ABC transport system permease protein
MNTPKGASQETASSTPGRQMKFGSYTALWEAFRISIDNIWAHKLRSFLTLLGIIIGVASVVTVGAAIEGLGHYVSDSLEGVLGSNTFSVTRIGRVRSFDEYEEKIRRNKPVYLLDMKLVMEKCEGCEAISPDLGRSDTIKRGDLVYEEARISGVSDAFPKIQELELSEGRFISPFDVSSGSQVAVIGSKIRDELFGPVDPINKDIRISGDKYMVIGIEAENGSLMGRSLDTNIYIPYTAFLQKYGTRQSISFKVKAPNTESLHYTQDEVRQILRTKRKLKPNQEDTFDIVATEEVQETIGQLTGMITVVIMPVILISMVVAAIVVMNIMLVVVTERTKEIGMRKSVGARRKDILLQFLVESALLASIGGGIGVLLAYVVSTIIKTLTPVPMYITLMYVVFAILSSGVIGVISGIYPAYRAAKLDPIIALTRD